eukprot:TRINITY_DN705_c4_g1_i2.p1 TRINITY_DN705_c4_g1~~TRINITY_DN705_c4_g1_i2.p1  ORF type:complete len:519 (+),score=113.01 TRINITY_DN705_c4_g1_i2:255-1811(+)
MFTVDVLEYPASSVVISDRMEVVKNCSIMNILEKVQKDCLREFEKSSSKDENSVDQEKEEKEDEEEKEEAGEEEEEEELEELEEQPEANNELLKIAVDAFRQFYPLETITPPLLRDWTTDDIEMELHLNRQPNSIIPKELAEAWGLSFNHRLIIRVVFQKNTKTPLYDEVVVFQRTEMERKKAGCLQLGNILKRFLRRQSHLQKLVGEMGYNQEKVSRLDLENMSCIEAAIKQLENNEDLDDSNTTQNTQQNQEIRWQLIEEHDILVKIYDYVKKRLGTLNKYCLFCDNPFSFVGGNRLTACNRDFCFCSYSFLGMADQIEHISSEAQVIDLLIGLAIFAANSSTEESFEPYPLVLDSQNIPILTPFKKDFEFLREILDTLPSAYTMAKSTDDLETQLDRSHPYAFPLFQWIIEANRSHIVRVPKNDQKKDMSTPFQYLLMNASPEKEEKFMCLKEKHGSVFAFYGSPIENWHSILYSGIKKTPGNNYYCARHMCSGTGIHLSPLVYIILSFYYFLML